MYKSTWILTYIYVYIYIDAVKCIVRTLLGERITRMKIFAGDVVQKKKPSPDIYLLAANQLDVLPERCWVIEDSEIGLKAAKAAGVYIYIYPYLYIYSIIFVYIYI